MLCKECGSEIMSSAVYCPFCGAKVPDAVEPDDYVYEAFISYRHLPTDRSAAMRVQRALEGASIPAEIQQRVGKKRLGRLFRDEDELSAAASLSDTIVEALKQSRFLIVICSPETRKSQWVLREVETFASIHGRDKILVALVAGEPAESFPPLLLSRLEKDEDTGRYVKVPAEPLAANLRDTNAGAFNREVVRLEASMLGCAYDDLLQRLRTRRLRFTIAVSVALMIASLAFAVFVLYQRMLVQESYLAAVTNESMMLAKESAELLADGNRIDAVRSALRALPGEQASGDDRPYVPEAQLALERALYVYPSSSPWQGLYTIEGARRSFDCKGNLQAMGKANHDIMLVDTESGAPLATFDARQQLGAEFVARSGLTAVKFGSGTLLGIYESKVVCYDVSTGACLWLATLPQDSKYREVAYLESTGEFVVFSQDNPSHTEDEENSLVDAFVSYFDEDKGIATTTALITSFPYGATTAMDVTPDGERVAIASGNGVALLGRRDANGLMEETPSTRVTADKAYVADLDFVGESILVTSCDGFSFIFGHVSYELLDSELKRIWIHEQPNEKQFDAFGGILPANAFIVGDVTPEEVGVNQILAVCGAQYLFLNAEDGTVTYEESVADAIVDAYVESNKDEGVVVAGCTFDGVLFRRKPFSHSEKIDGLYTYRTDAPVLMGQPITDGGGFVGYAVWSSHPSRCRVYGIGRVFGTKESETADERVMNTAATAGKTSLVGVEGDQVFGFDPNTFAPTWEASCASLGFAKQDDEPIKIASTSAVFLLAPSADDASRIKVVELSYQDGSVLATYAVSDEDLAGDRWSRFYYDMVATKDGTRMLMANDFQGVHVFDLVSGRELLDLDRAQDAYFGGCCLGNKTAIVHEVVGSRGAYSLYSLETGEKLVCDISDALALELINDGHELSYNRKTIVLGCVDGVLRAYDMRDGHLLWESSAAGTSIESILKVAKGRLVVQDSLGRSTLIDATNGQRLATSEAVLPLLEDAVPSSDGATSVATYYDEATSRDGIVIFNLDPEAFGPISNIVYGHMVSRDGKKVLVKTPWDEDPVIYPRYSLDELIWMGRSVVDSFDGQNPTEAVE